MPARIFCKTGRLRGRTFDIGEEATVGSGGDNAIVLPATTISRRHARIFFDADRGTYFVEDLDSMNGTRVDGHRVRDGERLGALNVITFAESHDFIFQRLEGQAATTPRSGGEPTARDAADKTMAESVDVVPVPEFEDDAPAEAVLTPPPARAFLELELQDGLWTRFPLAQGANVLGRSRACAIAIDNDKLSRQHATLTVAGNRVVVRDLETTNRTFVDGEPISEEVEIADDATLRFGPVKGRVLWET